MKSKTIILTIALLVLTAFQASAQNAIVKEVRELYANAQQRIAEMKEEPNGANYMTVKKHYIVPAIGPVEETLEFYAFSNSCEEGEEDCASFSPLFIRQKIDAGPTSMGVTFKEFLYDAETGSLRFFFFKTNAAYVGEDSHRVNRENRAYYDKDGGFVTGNVKMTSLETGEEIKANDMTEDGSTGGILSMRLVEAFNLLMNTPAE